MDEQQKKNGEFEKFCLTRDSRVYFPSLHDMCIISSVIEGCKSGLYARSRGGERCSSYVILQYTRVPECPFDSNKTSWLSIQSNCLFLRETSSKERCTRIFRSFKIHSRKRKFWIEMLKGIVSYIYIHTHILITVRRNNVLHNIFSVI